jgi:hypothetical protein
MTTHNADADIFDVPAENLVSHGSGGSAYKAEPGIHQATCVALVDQGNQENSFKPGSVQRKGQILWALNDQTLVFTKEGKEPEDTLEPITVISKPYTLSFHEKAALPKDMATLGIKVDPKTTTFGSLLGTKCMLIIGRDEEDRVSVQVAPPAKNQADPEKPVYLPKFWLSDKDGKPTGWKIKKIDKLVIEGERPKHEK